MNKPFDTAVKLLRSGEYKKAQKILEGIVAKKPNEARALINLGIAYKNQGQLTKAIEVYKKAIKLRYKTFAAYNNLANAYLEQNEFALAKNSFLKAIELKPDYAEGYGNLGVYFQTKGNKTLAKRYYKKAIVLNPDLFDTLYNFSSILGSEGNYKKALKFAKKAIEIDPDNAPACNNLANILRGIGELDEARKYYQKAIKLDSRLASVYPNLLDVLLRLGEKDLAEKIHKKMDSLGAETPYWALKLHKSPSYRLQIAKTYSERIKGEAMRANLRLGYWIRRKKEKIKVGYIFDQIDSPFFDLHDKKKFEIYKYPYHDIRNLTDAQVAKRINKKRIDILIDLVGHSERNRMGIFAHHPSPFQISYSEFGGTSGADFMEYAIVDKTLVPEKEAKYYSEKLIYIPNCYQIKDRKHNITTKIFVKNLESEYIKIVGAGKRIGSRE